MGTVTSRRVLDKGDFLEEGIVLNTSTFLLTSPTDLVHCNIKHSSIQILLIRFLVTGRRLRQDGIGLRCGARADKRVIPECAIATSPYLTVEAFAL